MEEIRKAARLGQPVMNKRHIDRFLIPCLGSAPLDRLWVAHVHAMFTAIAAEAETIAAANQARREAETLWKSLQGQGPGGGSRVEVEAGGDAAVSQTDQRRHSAVDPGHAALGAISGLHPAADHGERRRVGGSGPGQAAEGVGMDAGTGGAVAADRSGAVGGDGVDRAAPRSWSRPTDPGRPTQITEVEGEIEAGTPKSDAGERDVALDDPTVAALKAQRRRQAAQRRAAGAGWVDTGLVFTQPDGTELQPSWVSDQFRLLNTEADLPPTRLHDLRHGAATLALAAGIDVKVVSEMLGHSTTITRDTYTSVFDELKHAAANAIAQAINSPATGTTPGGR